LKLFQAAFFKDEIKFIYRYISTE